MMIVNPEKFQAIIIDRNNQQNNPSSLEINREAINSEISVRLLRLEIDSKLNFDKHIAQLLKKSANQLNTLVRLNSFRNKQQRKILANSLKYANFNYCPIVWLFFFQRINE